MALGAEYTLSAPDVLTRLYPNGIIEAFAAENPTFGMFAKKDILREAGRELNWQISSGAGDAGDIAEAEANQAPGTHKRPFIVRSREYGTATVDRETLMATQDKDAIIEVWDLAIKDCQYNMKQSIGMHAYRDGSGIRATAGVNAGGYGTTTIVLADKNDAKLFRIGMWVQVGYGTTTSITLRAAGAKAQIVGRSIGAGTLTLAGNWSATFTGMSDGDFIARSGDMVPINGVGVIKGLGFWVPETAPGVGDNCFGVDRHLLGEGAYGHRPTSNSSSIYNILVDASAYLFDMGAGAPDICLCNSLDQAAAVKDLSGISMIQIPSQNSKGELIGNIGYDAVRINGANGKIDLVADPFVPRGKAKMGNRETFEWWTMGDMIQLIRLGMGEQGGYVNQGVDGISMRFGGFMQGVVTNPYNWAHVALPTSG